MARAGKAAKGKKAAPKKAAAKRPKAKAASPAPRPSLASGGKPRSPYPRGSRSTRRGVTGGR